jgi:antirestriction protein ArdC
MSEAGAITRRLLARLDEGNLGSAYPAIWCEQPTSPDPAVVRAFPPDPDIIQPHPQADALVSACDATIVHGGSGAYYSPASDWIHMPDANRFYGADAAQRALHWYATLFHELIHWTSHKQRLDRRREPHGRRHSIANCDDELEELVAEIGSVILLTELGIVDEPPARALRCIRDHADMLGRCINYAMIYYGDIESTRRNMKSFYTLETAAQRAEKAVSYLRGLQP